MVLTLYKIDASPPARAAMMALDILNIKDVEFVDVNLLTGAHLKPEYVKMNPQHTIPTLKDGDFVIWDSHAIIVYLINKYARDVEDSLYPKDAQKRAVVDQRMHFDSSILFPALRATVFPVLYNGEKKMDPVNLDKIKSAYNFLEKFADKTWIAGDQMTIADICCVATASTLNTMLPIDEAEYPQIKAWLSRFENLDFYKNINVPGLEMFDQLMKSKLA